MSNPATTYEEYFVPIMFAPLVQPMLAKAAPRPGERILDLGCGSGIVARQVAALLGSGARVTGLDASPAMLTVAEQMAAREGAEVEWVHGAAEALPFKDGSFDVVLCQQALQFCPDRPAALGELRRVLAGGGRLVISMWFGLDQFPVYAALDAAIEKHLGSRAIATAFSAGPPESIHALLIAAAFREVEVERIEFTARFPYPKRYVALQIESSSAAIPALQHLDDATRAELVGKIEAEMRPVIERFTVGDEMVTPAVSHLARGVR
jgi:ubiquinone/menaquinone biosynthesis C-methylase UbiE